MLFFRFFAVLVLFLAVVAKLAVNGFQLFAEVIIFLRTFDALPHGGRNTLFDFGNFQFVVQALFQQFQAFHRVGFFQNPLLDVQPHAHGVDDGVDVFVRVGGEL